MTPDDISACFDRFTGTVFRLECRRAYAVDAETEEIAAFRLGRPRPVRSVRTSKWLARIAVTTIAGKHWQRVRIADDPLTGYQEFQLGAYVESQAAGEEIRIAARSAGIPDDHDFWLFDGGTLGAYALFLDYGDDDQFTAARLVADPEALARCQAIREQSLRLSVPLNEYLAGRVRTAA